MFCSKVKEHLSQKGVKYTERDVSKDEAAIDELKKTGAMTTPVTLIDGEMVIGFDRQKLDQLSNG